ncbi:caspase family protein [Streptomyces sp. TE5632]
MVVRALVVCPETYEGSSLRPMSGSLASGVRFASWLVSHVAEPCSITFLSNAGPLPDPLPARLKATSADLVAADLGSMVKFFARPRLLDGLKEADAFVLYWIGHGTVSREGRRHFLYLPYNQRVELEDLQRGMAGPGRPERQLFVIDACREADFAQSPDGGVQTLVTADGVVPHPDWDPLVLYGARHGEQALFDEGRGGVFTDRLLDELEALPSGDRLDLEQIEQTAVALEDRFCAAYRQEDPGYGQIPTHYWLSRRGLSLVDQDFLPGVAVTAAQAEALRRAVERAELTPLEESGVWEWLHAFGPRIADDLSLPETAVRVTRLPHRADGGHCITDLCAVLARIERLRDDMHQWYASWATGKGLPPLATVSVPPASPRQRGHLVIDLQRQDELSHGPAPTAPAEPTAPWDARGPSYRAQAWFYTEHKRQRIRLQRQSWRKDEFATLVEQIHHSAPTKVRSALDGAWVEFIVDRDLFGHRFDTLPSFAVPSGKAPLLGDSGPVVLRDRWRHRKGPQTLRWQRGASLLDSVPAARLQWSVCTTSCATGGAELARHAQAVETAFLRNGAKGTNGAAEPYAGIVLSRPLTESAHFDLVGTALNNGALLAIWPDRPPADGCARGGDDGAVCDGALVRESLMRRLDGRPLHDLPEIVFDLRSTGGDEGGVFRDMVVLFDDPRRSPFVPTSVTMP